MINRKYLLHIAYVYKGEVIPENEWRIFLCKKPFPIFFEKPWTLIFSLTTSAGIAEKSLLFLITLPFLEMKEWGGKNSRPSLPVTFACSVEDEVVKIPGDVLILPFIFQSGW